MARLDIELHSAVRARLHLSRVLLLQAYQGVYRDRSITELLVSNSSTEPLVSSSLTGLQDTHHHRVLCRDQVGAEDVVV